MLRALILRLKASHLQAMQDQKGQSIVIVTFAFLGLIAMLGLALDLGLVYIEQVRISRTTDAAALAGVVELPFEEETMRRAIEFIELNGYRVNGPDADTRVVVRGCIVDPGLDELRNVDIGGVLNPSGSVPVTPTNTIAGDYYQGVPPGEDARAEFVIDTLSYQPVDDTTVNEDNCVSGGDDDASLYGTANKVRVAGRVGVGMNFMQFFGWRTFPVQDQAVGENVTNLDVVVVFDVSGSMDYETTCFDCWEKDEDLDILENPFPNNGTFNPLPDTTSDDLCTADPAPLEQGGFKYLVHEAELYSSDAPPPSGPTHAWAFTERTPGQGFWVLQRANNRDASGTPTDTRGAYIRAHPFPSYSQSSVADYPQQQGGTYDIECFNGPDQSGQCWLSEATALGEAPPLSNVPWVEYDFTPDWSGDTHIWIRAQGGGALAFQWNGRSPASLLEWRKSIYWQVGRQATGVWSDVDGGPFDRLDDDEWTSTRRPTADKWRWVKLGSVATTNGVQHTLKLFQGSSGFYVDKIILTDDPTGSVGVAVDDSGATYGGSVSADFEDILTQNGGQGPAATDGSATREACNVCNPEFGKSVDPTMCSCKKDPSDTTVVAYPAGGTGISCTRLSEPINQLNDDLYHDVDPLRSAKEAVKNFAVRLDPKFDQVGFVAYNSAVINDSDKRSELQCLRWSTVNDPVDGVRGCYDPATDPISYTTVIRTVESHTNGLTTNIAEGLREGLEELGIEVPGNTGIDSSCDDAVNDKKVCDRRGAARRVLILMTDGSPNRDDNCVGGAGLWQGNFGQGNKAYDCAIHYARLAANNNVTLYTIGIGSGVNVDLLTAMATGTDPGTDPETVYFQTRGGRYFPAASPADLDSIFEQILSNIFVRIAG